MTTADDPARLVTMDPITATNNGAPAVVVEEDGWQSVSASTMIPLDAEAIRATLRDDDDAEVVSSSSTRAGAAPTGEPADADAADAAPPPPSPGASATASDDDSDGESDAAPKADAKAQADADAEAKAKEAAAEDAKPKPKRTREARIAELDAEIKRMTWRKHQEARELEELAQRRQALAPTAPAAPQAPAPAARTEAAPPPSPADAAGPKPTWAAYEAQGKAWDEYVEARDAWTDRVRAAERAADRAEIEREYRAREEARRDAEIEQAHQARMAAARQAREDFDATIESALGPDSGVTIQRKGFIEAVVKHHADGPEVLYQLAKNPDDAAALAKLEPLCTEGMYLAVMEAQRPATVLLHFAQHPQEFRELVEMPRAKAMLTLGKLIARLDSAPAPVASLSPAPVTLAKPPIRPVGGARNSGGGDADDDEDKLSFDDWLARADKREAEQRRARRHA